MIYWFRKRPSWMKTEWMAKGCANTQHTNIFRWCGLSQDQTSLRSILTTRWVVEIWNLPIREWCYSHSTMQLSNWLKWCLLRLEAHMHLDRKLLQCLQLSPFSFLDFPSQWAKYHSIWVCLRTHIHFHSLRRQSIWSAVWNVYEKWSSFC